MASVTLDGVWVNLASDLSQYVQLDTFQVQASETSDMEIRKYAGGRYRSITTPGSQWTVSVGFRYASRADIATLRGWRNQTVLYRDLFGRRFWATFASVNEDEQLDYRDRSLLVASVTFNEITYTEAV